MNLRYLGDELRMEGDDNSGRDEDSSRVERASTLDVASVEWQGDGRDLRASCVVATGGVVVESLN